ncbi:MAG: aspartate 1-decarboxylase [Candidatus Melainabacteria bacterium]
MPTPPHTSGPEPLIELLQAKIHRATVTDAQLHYEGSITIDAGLLQRAGLLPHQAVEIYNVTNGNRFKTYIIEGEAHSGIIQINGAAAHLATPGDLVIIAAYCQLPRSAAVAHQPTCIRVDARNRPVTAPAPALA